MLSYRYTSSRDEMVLLSLTAEIWRSHELSDQFEDEHLGRYVDAIDSGQYGAACVYAVFMEESRKDKYE